MRYNQAPLTCGAFANGEVEDYTLKVKCNMVTTTTEGGNGSLRNVCACVPNGEPVLFSPALNGQIIQLTTGPIVSNGMLKWMATSGSNIEIKAVGISRILSVPVGKSAEIQNLKLMGGTATMGSAIDNAGTLILRDCIVHPSPGMTNTVIYNSGSLSMFGMTMIQF
jgi:hypothetical protein